MCHVSWSSAIQFQQSPRLLRAGSVSSTVQTGPPGLYAWILSSRSPKHHARFNTKVGRYLKLVWAESDFSRSHIPTLSTSARVLLINEYQSSRDIRTLLTTRARRHVSLCSTSLLHGIAGAPAGVRDPPLFILYAGVPQAGRQTVHQVCGMRDQPRGVRK